MLPQPADWLEMTALRRRELEAAAAAERLRPRGGSRRRAAHLLRLLADRIAPPPVGDGRLVAR